MVIRSRTHLLLPLLVLGLSLAMVASVQAQNRDYRGSSGTSATLQVSFGTTPHWTGIRGTRVMEVRQDERQGYDTFRYGGNYYAYSNNQWYRSHRANGQYAQIQDRSVPSQLSRVPRDHWRNYPQGWGDRNNNGRPGAPGQRH